MTDSVEVLLEVAVYTAFLYYDLRNLRGMAPGLFVRCCPSTRQLRLWAILLCAAGFGFLWFDRLSLWPVIVVGLTAPFYVIQRWRFRRAMEAQSADVPETARLVADAFGIVLGWMGGIFALSAILHLTENVVAIENFGLLSGIILTIAAAIVMVVLIARVVRQYPSFTLKQALALSARGLPAWWLGVVPATVGLALAGVSAGLIVSRQIQPVTPFSETLDFIDGGAVLITFIFAANLFAPFAEEIILRGFFFTVMRRVRGRVFTVAAIALIFALLHTQQYWGDWPAILLVGTVGLMLTLLREKTGSVVPGIVLHYVYNAGMVILPIVFMSILNPPFYQYQLNYENLSFAEKTELLEESVQRQPQMSNIYYELAGVYLEEDKKLSGALRLIDQALALNPERSIFELRKARILQAMDRNAEAMDVVQPLVERYPNRKQFRNLKADIQAALQQQQQQPQDVQP